MNPENNNQDAPKTPLERVRETQQINRENLAAARGDNAASDQAMQAESDDTEQRRVDVTTETPGSIGRSGQDSNPREHPQRKMG